MSDDAWAEVRWRWRRIVTNARARLAGELIYWALKVAPSEPATLRFRLARLLEDLAGQLRAE